MEFLSGIIFAVVIGAIAVAVLNKKYELVERPKSTGTGGYPRSGRDVEER